MSAPRLPLVLEPADLEPYLHEPELRVIDLSKPDIHARAHIPGAIHLDYAQIVAARPPMMGLVPPAEQLSAMLSSIGYEPDQHIIAYDDEGGGRAARLLWTLTLLGHRRYSLLNGGLHAWMGERRPLTDKPYTTLPTDYRTVAPTEHPALADLDYIRGRLGAPGLALVDARSAMEFSGHKRFAVRGGHIPGAVNVDWLSTMNQQDHLRFKPAEELRQRFGAAGVSPDKEVVVYCQTHHRSAHTFILLKYLGYPKVRGYPGSWSEWGNHPDTPVEE